jgi:hypothetical protein
VSLTEEVDICGEPERTLTAALNELYALFKPLTMASVARRIGVSEPAVSHWLRGRRIPQERSLVRLHAEAVKIALATGRTVSLGLDELMRMRHEVHCSPAVCADVRAAGSVSAEGDRRNEGWLLGSSGGTGATHSRVEGVGVGKRSPTAEVFAVLDKGNRNEAFRILRDMSLSEPLVRLQSVVGAFLDRGREDAARVLLEGMLGRPGSDMVEMVVFAFRAHGEVQY